MSENMSTTAAAGAQETQTAGAPETTAVQPEEKKFSQTELDDIVEKRLARERRKFPSQEELTAFRTWQETHQTEQQKQQRILDERNGFEQRVTALESELLQAQHERALLRRGVPADDVDYYAYKIGKMVSDTVPFETAMETFLRSRPVAPAPESAPQGVRASFGAPMGRGAHTESLAERINRQLRGG